MSDNLITILAKTKTGAELPIQVAAIVSIDGKPYQPAGDLEVLFQHFNHLSGRVDTLERLLTSFVKEGE
jgi:hypothetical protein